MLNTLKPLIRLGLLGISLTVLPLAAGLPDRLQQPSPQSDAAFSVMLTDIVRAGDRLVAVGDMGVVIYSDDQGQQWQQASVPVTTLLTSVDFTSAERGWATGHDGVLLQTDDAGANWTLKLDGYQLNELKVTSLQAQLDSLAETPSDDPLLEEDLMFALEDAEFALEEGPANPLLRVWFRDAETGFLLGAYGTALKTTDAGETWQLISERLPNPDQMHLNAITMLDGALIIAGEAGLLMRSDDQGDSWYALPSPYQGSFFDLVAHKGKLFALGLRGHLFVSADGGFDWGAVPVDTTVSFMGGYSDNQQLAIAGLGGTLLSGGQYQDLTELNTGVRRHFNAVVPIAAGWVLAGEQGIYTYQLLGADQ
ncbi:photosystem I reaction center subunit IV [Nitrincola iocasae]|uniref:Photosystem I reaction center subunit IV n=1 Tax=Nitrincola iocasae TaxID=2614693 RepID=A0A5J6LGK1_9GAMM|nr:photosystem I reaction center subunit IV [Nitrincola iocasae]